MQVCKLPQKEFVSSCIQTKGVEGVQASAFYQKLWRTRIDFRQRSLEIKTTENLELIKEPQVKVGETPLEPLGRSKLLCAGTNLSPTYWSKRHLSRDHTRLSRALLPLPDRRQDPVLGSTTYMVVTAVLE